MKSIEVKKIITAVETSDGAGKVEKSIELRRRIILIHF